MNNAEPFWSASAGLNICSNVSGFMSAYSSMTRNLRLTPRIVSGLSDPFKLIVDPFINFIWRLLICDDATTGCPSSNKVCHIMSLACPWVGAT